MTNNSQTNVSRVFLCPELARTFVSFFLTLHKMYPTINAEFDALGYGYAREEFIMCGQSSLGERSLWCAIIEQAFIDVGLISDLRGVGRGKTAVDKSDPKNNGRAKKCYDEAARWLLYGKQDFMYVCMMAGISPSLIRRAALLKLK